MTSLKVNLKFLEAEFEPKEPDREAAWEMYIELLTRITTQPLPTGVGDEATALESVHRLFPITREILRRRGSDCFEFSKIGIVVLNQVIRPFTAKWHRESLAGAFEDSERCAEFRQELAELRMKLQNYTRMLAAMAEVEDLTMLEDSD
ncbi:MAG: hypothetical protein GY835_09625 [bacterium]|nr:hypothetical protein [bacterium]